MHFRTYHEFKFLSRFRKIWGFCNIPEFGNNQHFPAKTHFHYYKISQFWWMIKLVLRNVLKSEFLCDTEEKSLKIFLFIRISWNMSSIFTKNVKKYAKIMDSNLRNETWAKSVSNCFQTGNVLKHDMRPKCAFNV